MLKTIFSEETIKFLIKQGPWALVAGVLVFIVYLLHKLLFKKWKNIKEENEYFKDYKKYKIHHHPFFAQIDNWIEFDIPELDIACSFRKTIFTDFLKLHFKYFKQCLYDFAVDCNISEVSQENFKFEIMKTFNNCWDTIWNKANEEGIPKIVIRKYKRWINTSRRTMQKFVEQICDSTVLPTNKIRMSLILNSALAISSTILVESEKVLSELNGDLDNIDYKGLKHNEHCEHSKK